MATNSNDLVALMQTLPQELWDRIYNDVFTVDKNPRHVTTLYRAPPQLHVSKDTRELFARAYYGESAHFNINQAVAMRWTMSLPLPYLTMIRTFTILPSCESSKEGHGAPGRNETIGNRQVYFAFLKPHELRSFLLSQWQESVQLWVQFEGVGRTIWNIDMEDGVLRYEKDPVIG